MPRSFVPARLRVAVHRSQPAADHLQCPPRRIAGTRRRTATSILVSGLIASMFGGPTSIASATEGSTALQTSGTTATSSQATSVTNTASVTSTTDWTFDSSMLSLALTPAATSATASGSTSSDADLAAAVASAGQADSALAATSTVATAATRVAAQHPFAVTAPANTSIGSGAKFESSYSTRTAGFLKGTPVINASNWTVSVAIATSTSPNAKVRNLKSGVTTYIRIPSTATTTADTDKALTVVQPDGYTAYECYKMTKVAANSWTTTSMIKQDLRSTGLSAGTRASGVSQVMGLIRAKEVIAKKIPHSLAVAIPDSMLKSGYVWPARRQDSNASTAYQGQVPMGTMLGIPPSVNVAALGLTGEGLALAHALQDYGAHVVERAGMVALYAEPASDAAAISRMKTDWRKLYPLMRAISNNTPTTVGGGGTPRQPAAGTLQ